MTDQRPPNRHPTTAGTGSTHSSGPSDAAREPQTQRPQTQRPAAPDGMRLPPQTSSAVHIPEPANDPRFPAAPAHVTRTQEAPTPRSASGQSAGWRWFKRIAILIAVLLGGVLVAIAALQIRLDKGPIEVPQLVGPIQNGLSNELGNTAVTVGSVALYKAERTGRLEFRLNDLQLFDEAGSPAVHVPTAAIDISRNALVRGSVAPKRIDLIGPRLELSYDDASGLRLRFAGFQASEADGEGENSLGLNIPPISGAEASTGIPDRRRTAVGLVEVLRETFKAARDRTAATSFLKSVGVRDAVIVLKTPKVKTTWTAPNLALELWHQSSRSLIRGNGTLTEGTAPWAFAFEVDDTPARGAFQVRTLFKDLIPGELGRAVPTLSELGTLETPFSGQANFQLSQNGALAAASADIVLGAGFMGGAETDKAEEKLFKGVLLDEGHVQLTYDGAKQVVRVEKLDLLTARGRMVVAGELKATGATPEPNWGFDLNGKMRFVDVSSDLMPLSDVALAGVIESVSGNVRVDRFNFAWPEGQIAGRGQISPDGGMSLSGQLGEMSKVGLLQAWPPFVAVEARQWIERNIRADLISGGQFSMSLPKDFSRRMKEGGDIPAEAVSFDVSTQGMEIDYVKGAPPLRFKTATTSIRGRILRVKAPAGLTKLPSGKTLKLSQSDLLVRDLRVARPETQMFMKVSGEASALTEFLELDSMGYLRRGVLPEDLKGAAEGNIRLRFPMHQALRGADVKLNGKFKLIDGASRKGINNFRIAGAAIDFDLTEKAVEATGEVLINGVPAKVRWLRLLEGGDDRQPPLRISAKLDASDRKQLGLNINHFLTGVVSTDISIQPLAGRSPQITVQTDLTQAEVALDYLGWKKPIGQSTISQFDVIVKDDGTTELQNFKVVGDDVAVDGWLELGKDNRVRRFALPEFSIDVITRMDVRGVLGKNNVWDVKVKSSTFDARPIFRNLFSPKRFTEHVAPKEVRRDGVIIRAFIQNMVGFSDETVKDMQIVFQRKDGKVAGLEANGALRSGAPIVVSMKPNRQQQRILFGESSDAGAAFRLVGFYNNILRGEAKLQVNLDTEGPADVNGILWTRKFFMLGDPVVNEVLASSGRRDDGGPVSGINTRRDQRGKRRTVIEFDQLKFNFSVGNGQFVLNNSYVNGPALGATLNGKVDFERRLVNLGGTYVPLYGLNSALGALPILGNLLVGRVGEGVLGITFGIQGRLDKPEVLVNPVSLVAPGIFRQIFEISPQRQKITPRRTRPARTPPRKSKPSISSSWPIESRN